MQEFRSVSVNGTEATIAESISLASHFNDEKNCLFSLGRFIELTSFIMLSVVTDLRKM